MKKKPSKSEITTLPEMEEPAESSTSDELSSSHSMETTHLTTATPLADRMRPVNLEEFIGQEHLLGPDQPLQRLIHRKNPPSMILWGPPGTGKTTLARIIGEQSGSLFLTFSAVLTGIKEVRDAMSDAAYVFKQTGRRTVVFIDEIHRFNKAQQDAFLPFVESGQILLIGATTVNPSFDLNAALLSRLKVYILHGLEPLHLETILRRALSDPQRGLGAKPLELPEGAIHRIALFSSGDARRALNLLEHLAHYLWDRPIDGPMTEAEWTGVLQQKVLLYDTDGEEHFNMLSALHKSMRNSDPQAATYWVVRMLESGEDPRNICRRILQCASEDVGLADPHALTLSVSAWQAFEMLGLPEGRLAILQAVVYVAVAPKSNQLYIAWTKASNDVLQASSEPVPLHLRNAPTRMMKDAGYGNGYLYAHDYPEGTTNMTCLPPSLANHVYYSPSSAGLEPKIADKMREIETRRNRFEQHHAKEKGRK